MSIPPSGPVPRVPIGVVFFGSRLDLHEQERVQGEIVPREVANLLEVPGWIAVLEISHARETDLPSREEIRGARRLVTIEVCSDFKRVAPLHPGNRVQVLECILGASLGEYERSAKVVESRD